MSVYVLDLHRIRLVVMSTGFPCPETRHLDIITRQPDIFGLANDGLKCEILRLLSRKQPLTVSDSIATRLNELFNFC